MFLLFVRPPNKCAGDIGSTMSTILNVMDDSCRFPRFFFFFYNKYMRTHRCPLQDQQAHSRTLEKLSTRQLRFHFSIADGGHLQWATFHAMSV